MTARTTPLQLIRSRQVGARCSGRASRSAADHEPSPRAATAPGRVFFGHDELAEHYAAVETRHGCSGRRGGLLRTTLPPPGELAGRGPPRGAVAARWPARRVIPRRVIPRRRRHALAALHLQGSVLGEPSRRVADRPAWDGGLARRTERGRARGDGAPPGRRGRGRSRACAAVVLAASTIESVRLLQLVVARTPRRAGKRERPRSRPHDHVGLRLVGTLPAAFADAPPVAEAGRPRFTNVPGGESTDFARGYGIIVNLQPPARRIRGARDERRDALPRRTA